MCPNWGAIDPRINKYKLTIPNNCETKIRHVSNIFLWLFVRVSWRSRHMRYRYSRIVSRKGKHTKLWFKSKEMHTRSPHLCLCRSRYITYLSFCDITSKYTSQLVTFELPSYRHSLYIIRLGTIWFHPAGMCHWILNVWILRNLMSRVFFRVTYHIRKIGTRIRSLFQQYISGKITSWKKSNL